MGLKVDVEALPRDVQDAIEDGKLNLDDPATTLRLLEFNAVIGLTGFFNDPKQINSGLKAFGIQCALCHSTVDDALADQGRGFFHDGRFKSLLEVVDQYNDFMHLELSPQQKSDLVEYLKSI